MALANMEHAQNKKKAAIPIEIRMKNRLHPVVSA